MNIEPSEKFETSKCVYIVEVHSGSYDDYVHYIAGIFDNPKAALAAYEAFGADQLDGEEYVTLSAAPANVILSTLPERIEP